MRKIFIVSIIALFIGYGCSEQNVKKEYYENGEIKIEIPYNETQQIDGVVTSYHENGAIRCKYPYTSGKIEGVVKCYYPDGSLEYKTPYKDSVKHGLATYFHPNGKVRVKGKYVNGKQEGVFKVYYKNGGLKSKQHWFNNRNVGKYLSYYPNGNLKMIALNDSTTGEPYYYREYNPTGDTILSEHNPRELDVSELLFEYREARVSFSPDDTVKVGEPLKATISITGENFISGKVLIGELNKLGLAKELIKEVEKEVPMKINKGVYEFKPKETGTHQLTGDIVLTDLFGRERHYVFSATYVIE